MPIYLIALLCLLNHACFSGSRMVMSLHALELGASQFSIGVGSGQPMSMSLIYVLAPAGRTSEAAGLRVMVNNVAHLFIPLFFGSLGTAFGFAPVFVSNAAMLAAGGVLLQRKNRIKNNP